MGNVNPLALALGIGVIILTVYVVMRRVDVRLALFPAGLALSALAGQPMAIIRAFFSAFADPRTIVPICSAMGFAYVLKHTGCDQHLVHLLVNPVRKMRALMIPATVVIGFIVNATIVSQTSTAMAIGPVLVGLLAAAGLSPITSGAGLLMGASIGGELLNPSAPEFTTVVRESTAALGAPVHGPDCVRVGLPIVLIQLTVATLLFWLISARAEAGWRKQQTAEPELPPDTFRLDLLKALVPLVPLVFIFLTARFIDLKDPSVSHQVFRVPQSKLVADRDLADFSAKAAPKRADDLFDLRLIGFAMLFGVGVATLVSLRTREGREAVPGVARAFFDGAGWAFKEVVAVIVIAGTFAEGVRLIGIGELIGSAVRGAPGLLIPTAGMLTLAFGVLCGSGIAATQGMFGFFAAPAVAHGVHPALVGSVASLGAAAGRTMSPFAPVNLVCSRLTSTTPADLSRRVAIPLLLGMIVAVLAASLLAPSNRLPEPATSPPVMNLAPAR